MRFTASFLVLISIVFASCTINTERSIDRFSFAVVADTRAHTGDDIRMFRGACEAVKEPGNDAFVGSPGYIDPPSKVLYTIHKYIRKDIPWYPIVGNHEAETKEDMEWLREYNKNGNTLPGIVNEGPESTKETMYSFDYGNSHFIILNEYAADSCDACTRGDINDMIYNWLKKDLEKNKKENVFVFGHEPAYPMPDIENQRFRHVHDCLNQYPENRDRFVELLQKYDAKAYIVGHTHNYSTVKVNNLWHMDAGHARGDGDKGTRSTFIRIKVNGGDVSYFTYRRNPETSVYELADKGKFN
jgi:uncharacterized protein YutD